jgi:hypothetical protein
VQLDSSIDVTPDATSVLTRGLPRDQALGLRLIALARAATGVHLGQVAHGGSGASMEHTAQESAALPQILRSQAKGLAGMSWGQAQDHGQDARATEGA